MPMTSRSCLAVLLALVLLVLPLGASAQSPSGLLSAGDASGLPGATNVAVTISLDSQGGAEIAGVNFDLTFDDARLDVSDVVIGSAAADAGKVLGWSQPSSNRIRVIIYAVANQNVIDDGAVAVVRFNVLGGAVPGDSELNLTNAAAGDPDANPVDLSLSDGTFSVLAPPSTNTPTATRTPTPTRTATRTRTPTRTRTITRTPTETPTGPTPTRTRTPRDTSTRTRTATWTPGTPTLTATGTATASPGILPTTAPASQAAQPSTPSETPWPEGYFPPEVETAAAATGTALAEFDAAVAGTATALAVGAQPVPPEDGGSLLPGSWLGEWTLVLLVGGAALVAGLGALILGFVVLRRRSSAGGKR
jgi:hypothetical protein